MKNKLTTSTSSALTRLINSSFTAALVPALLILLTLQPTYAGSATWSATPTNGDWNTAANWMPNTVPNGPNDTATFDLSSTTGLSLSVNTEVNGITFDSGASAYTISSTENVLTISGAGVTNNSGIAQNFVISNDAAIEFSNSSSAGALTTFTVNADTFGGYSIAFTGSSSASSSAFIMNGATDPFLYSGGLIWNSTGSSGSSTFINNGATASEANGGFTNWSGGSSLPNGSTFINNGASVNGAFGGSTEFATSPGNATLIANGGTNGGDGGQIHLNGNGGNPRVQVFGNGYLYTYANNITVGSLEGNGFVYLTNPPAVLTVGGNNLSTVFTGRIQYAVYSNGGAVVKTGRGKLTPYETKHLYKWQHGRSRDTTRDEQKRFRHRASGRSPLTAAPLGGTGIVSSGAVTIGLLRQPQFRHSSSWPWRAAWHPHKLARPHIQLCCDV